MKSKWKKRLLFTLICIVVAILIWNHLPYCYCNDKAVDYITNHAESESKCSCAGYVMRGMWRGGCPIGLLPAYGYSKTLPQMGFKEVSTKNYTPQRGDISVVPSNSSHPFGHIALYNGQQWVSDFKQNHILPSKAYKASGKYQIFRATDGWHWKHVWTSPLDWYGWIHAAIKGRNKIKF